MNLKVLWGLAQFDFLCFSHTLFMTCQVLVKEKQGLSLMAFHNALIIGAKIETR